MADYIPVFKPGDDLTLTAGATTTGGQLMYVSAANTVSPTTGATAAWLGVATQDAASGAKVGVTSGGVQELVAAATIAAGDVLIPASNGRVTPIASGTTYSQVVGVALTAASSGNTSRVRMAR
jgi:hypothetical protein